MPHPYLPLIININPDKGVELIGQKVAHYEVLEKLGEGGMGEVYLAEDTSLERKVALKFLPESLSQDEVAHRRFIREAKSVAALDHPYICKIYETGEVEGRNFIAMEYLKGQTLKESCVRLRTDALPTQSPGAIWAGAGLTCKPRWSLMASSTSAETMGF